MDFNDIYSQEDPRLSRSGAIRAVALLAAVWTNPITDATVELYVEHLSDLPDEPLGDAVRSLARTTKWLPSIAELREQTLRLAAPGSFPPTPEQAWNEVLGFASGPRDIELVYSHTLIKKAVRQLGGLYRVREATDANGIRRRFLDTYNPIFKERINAVLNLPYEQGLALNETNPTQAGQTATKSLSQASETEP